MFFVIIFVKLIIKEFFMTTVNPVNLSRCSTMSHISIITKTVLITTITLIALAYFAYIRVGDEYTGGAMKTIEKGIDKFYNKPVRMVDDENLGNYLTNIYVGKLQDLLPPIIYRNLKASLPSIINGIKADLDHRGRLSPEQYKKELLVRLKPVIEDSMPTGLSLRALSYSFTYLQSSFRENKGDLKKSLPRTFNSVDDAYKTFEQSLNGKGSARQTFLQKFWSVWAD
jgi:hypothetical protein